MTIEGRRGVFVEGAIEPAIKDVVMKISDGDTLNIEVITDVKGKYR